MLSTFDVLPTHADVIAGIPIPIIINVQPLSSTASVLSITDAKIPRCSRCRSYVSSVCAVSPEAWCCSVCSQIMHLSKPVPPQILEKDVIEVVESAEEQPLNHVLMLFTPVQKDVIKRFLELLPKRAPMTVITEKWVIPTTSISEVIEELDSIVFPDRAVPFEEAVSRITHSFDEFVSPCWARVFIEVPPFSMSESPLLEFVKGQYGKDVRMDFYYTGTSYSPLLTNIIQNTPGLSQVFHPITEGDMPEHLLADATRGFAFQLLTVFRSGVAYGVDYMPSPFMAAEKCESYVRIPVLPSNTASLAFQIIPPEADAKLRSQAMQCVVKFVRWNPETNRLSRLFRIISHEFKISSNMADVIKSVSPSTLFYAWLKEVQRLPPSMMSSTMQKKLSELAPVLAANEHLRSIIRMAFLAKSHPALSTADWDRLTMGSLLSLSSPSAVEAQFSYVVELWKDCDEFVEASFTVDEKKRHGDYVFIVKSFPSLFILTKEGEYDVIRGSRMEQSINKFVDECKPLLVSVVQSQLSEVVVLLGVDDEEGLPEYLHDVGLEAMIDDILGGA